MRILIDVTHPAYAWYFKPIVPKLLERGDQLLVTSREKDVATRLLSGFGIEHKCLSRAGKFFFGLARETIQRNRLLVKTIRDFQPHLVLARDGAFACQAAWMAGTPSISFDDTDDAWVQRNSYFPFATRIYTDRRYRVSAGRKHRYYDGVSALAYLHPTEFTPDRRMLARYRLKAEDDLLFVRLVSWTASHDVGKSGLRRSSLVSLVNELEKCGRVVISSEVPLPPELEKHRLNVDPADIHHVMAFAKLYVGESATMASEAAILGTHAVYVSSRHTWYTLALEKEFGLIRHAASESECLDIVRAFVSNTGIREEMAAKRQAYLDVSDNLVEKTLEAIDELRDG